MKVRLLTGVLSLLMPALVLAGEYNLTVDRVEIDTGDFVKEGIGYNGKSPGPVLRSWIQPITAAPLIYSAPEYSPQNTSAGVR